MDASTNGTGPPTSSHRHQLSSTSILHDRYVQNTLRPVPLDAASLNEILTELQAAIVRGVQIIREHTGNERTDSDRKDSIYVGHTGESYICRFLLLPGGRAKDCIRLTYYRETLNFQPSVSLTLAVSSAVSVVTGRAVGHEPHGHVVQCGFHTV